MKGAWLRHVPASNKLDGSYLCKVFPYLASFLREIRFVELRIVPLVKNRLSVDFGPQKEDQGPTTGLPVILVIIVSPSQSACIFFCRYDCGYCLVYIVKVWQVVWHEKSLLTTRIDNFWTNFGLCWNLDSVINTLRSFMYN